MSKRSNLAIGGLAIAGLSYLAGILTAPKSGRETRRDLKQAALKAKTEAERKLKKAHSELNVVLDKAKKIASSSKTKITAEFQAVIDQAEEVRQKARELLSAIHEGEADDKDLNQALKDVKQSVAHLKKYFGKTTKAAE